MNLEARAAGVRFPYAVADNTNATGVQRVACTGSAQTFALPGSSKLGRFVYFRAIGVEVQVAAAPTAQSLVLDQASNAAGASSSAAAGMTLFAGEFFDRWIEGSATHLCWISRTATGYVEFYVSEAKFS